MCIPFAVHLIAWSARTGRFRGRAKGHMLRAAVRLLINPLNANRNRIAGADAEDTEHRGNTPHSREHLAFQGILSDSFVSVCPVRRRAQRRRFLSPSPFGSILRRLLDASLPQGIERFHQAGELPYGSQSLASCDAVCIRRRPEAPPSHQRSVHRCTSIRAPASDPAQHRFAVADCLRRASPDHPRGDAPKCALLD